MHEERRAHQQDHRQRDLRGDQRSCDARGPPPAARLPGPCLENRSGFDADGPGDRREAEGERRDADGAGREREHAAVDAERHRHGVVAGREQPHEQIRSPGREEHSEPAARAREHQALEEQLLNQPRATGADGEPQRQFPAAPGRGREQQVRHRRAGDDQHQRHQAEEQPQRRLELASNGRVAGGARFEAARERQ